MNYRKYSIILCMENKSCYSDNFIFILVFDFGFILVSMSVLCRRSSKLRLLVGSDKPLVIWFYNTYGWVSSLCDSEAHSIYSLKFTLKLTNLILHNILVFVVEKGAMETIAWSTLCLYSYLFVMNIYLKSEIFLFNTALSWWQGNILVLRQCSIMGRRG